MKKQNIAFTIWLLCIHFFCTAYINACLPAATIPLHEDLFIQKLTPKNNHRIEHITKHTHSISAKYTHGIFDEKKMQNYIPTYDMKNDPIQSCNLMVEYIVQHNQSNIVTILQEPDECYIIPIIYTFKTPIGIIEKKGKALEETKSIALILKRSTSDHNKLLIKTIYPIKEYTQHYQEIMNSITFQKNKHKTFISFMYKYLTKKKSILKKNIDTIEEFIEQTLKNQPEHAQSLQSIIDEFNHVTHLIQDHRATLEKIHCDMLTIHESTKYKDETCFLVEKTQNSIECYQQTIRNLDKKIKETHRLFDKTHQSHHDTLKQRIDGYQQEKAHLQKSYTYVTLEEHAKQAQHIMHELESKITIIQSQLHEVNQNLEKEHQREILLNTYRINAQLNYWKQLDQAENITNQEIKQKVIAYLQEKEQKKNPENEKTLTNLFYFILNYIKKITPSTMIQKLILNHVLTLSSQYTSEWVLHQHTMLFLNYCRIAIKIFNPDDTCAIKFIRAIAHNEAYNTMLTESMQFNVMFIDQDDETSRSLLGFFVNINETVADMIMAMKIHSNKIKRQLFQCANFITLHTYHSKLFLEPTIFKKQVEVLPHIQDFFNNIGRILHKSIYSEALAKKTIGEVMQRNLYIPECKKDLTKICVLSTTIQNNDPETMLQIIIKCYTPSTDMLEIVENQHNETLIHKNNAITFLEKISKEKLQHHPIVIAGLNVIKYSSTLNMAQEALAEIFKLYPDIKKSNFKYAQSFIKCTKNNNEENFIALIKKIKNTTSNEDLEKKLKNDIFGIYLLLKNITDEATLIIAQEKYACCRIVIEKAMIEIFINLIQDKKKNYTSLSYTNFLKTIDMRKTFLKTIYPLMKNAC